MKEQKFNLKKRILIASLILILSFGFFAITSIKADLEGGASYNLGDFNCNNNAVSASATSLQSCFYHNATDRWYVIYVNQYNSGDFRFDYSYSDSGDITSWNAGGELKQIVYSWNPSTAPKLNYFQAWCYDNINEIGHLVRAYINTGNVYYNSFSIDEETGVITESSDTLIMTTLQYHYQAVDIAFDINGYPIIATCEDGNGATTEVPNVFFADSINGSEATWTNTYSAGIFSNYCSVSIIPTNDTQSAYVIIQDLEATNPLKYWFVESGVTANGTTPSTISTYNAWRHVTSSGGFRCGSTSVSYNQTHGVISYTKETDYDGQVIIFDFETTTTEEYTARETDSFSPVTVMNNNEFFMLCCDEWATTEDLYGTEQHNASFPDSIFNASANMFLVDDCGLADTSSRGLNGGSRFTDTQNRTAYLTDSGDNIYITFVNCEGEYAYVESEETEASEIEYTTLFLFGGVATFLIIFFLIIKARKELDL